MEIVEIEKIRNETPTIKSFFFDWGKDFEPGQFVMFWIPGRDEIPMVPSREGDQDRITVKKRGDSTAFLHRNTEAEDKIGIRGPYGNGYSLDGEKILAVMGGSGGASLISAITRAVEDGKEVHSCIGAETEEELLFREELSDSTRLHIATEDGSAGKECFVTELAADVMEEEDIDLVLTCGPEVMMKKVVDLCLEKGIKVQASLERYMKCGIGICDSCTIDGKQVCKDGPIFKGEELDRMEEFGRFERAKDGRLKEI
ncbi:MAG: dihydroorotate dehydrogenase electron transfer subunit [Candidatus Thermoplasmatota archaeon]|nr:dihydroorotate dehydrogenase electron transfer subunit [Candidatus Thermoplasmatota archaeon]